MTSSRNKLPDNLLPAFRIAPPGDVNFFTISESELESLEGGAPDPPLLAFGTGLLSAGVSFGIALATATSPSVGSLVFLWVATLFGVIGGSLLLVTWRQRRAKSRGVAERIRARQPPLVEAQLATEGEIEVGPEDDQPL